MNHIPDIDRATILPWPDFQPVNADGTPGETISLVERTDRWRTAVIALLGSAKGGAMGLSEEAWDARLEKAEGQLAKLGLTVDDARKKKAARRGR